MLVAPALPVLHLKSPSGGFRTPLTRPWAQDAVKPGVAPPFVLNARSRWVTRAMRCGYGLHAVLKRLGSHPRHRWPAALPGVLREWRCSVRWARWLATVDYAQWLAAEHRRTAGPPVVG